MFQIHDQPVTRSDAWWLVDQLRIVGRADDAIAAAAIEHALNDESRAVTLTERQWAAVLGALHDPPPGLVRLRGALS